MKKTSTHTPSINNQSLTVERTAVSIWTFLGTFVYLALITICAYYPSLNYKFQFDDIANIQKLFSIRFLTLSDIFMANARWLPFWLNALNYRMGRFEPYYYRLFNLSFHICAGLLVFALIYICLTNLKKESFFKTDAYFISAITSLLFLLHPVQTQTISYVIQGRLEGLATLFMLAIACCFVLAYSVQSKIVRAVLIGFMFPLAFLACGTKEIVIVTPALLLLIDWFFVSQGDVKQLLTRVWLHAALGCIIVGMYLYFLKPKYFLDLFGLQLAARNNIGNILTEHQHEKILPLHFFISQFKVVVHYLWIFIWPFNISVEYDWKMVVHFFAPDCLVPLFILMTIAGYVMYLARKNPISPIVFGFFWFAIVTAPRSSIIPSSELLADYKTYGASIGILFLLACGFVYGVQELIRHYQKHISSIKPIHALSTIMLCSCISALLTYQRNRVWESGEAFWANIIANAPQKARAYNNLAVAYAEQGKFKEAIPLYKKAIQMDGSYPDPWNNLAVCYSMTGKLQAGT